MLICGLNKTTLLDYPRHVAATVFTGGCNFRCPFCQNTSLVLYPESQPVYTQKDILSFLEKRKGVLEGVCITGGEPTLHPDLPRFLCHVKSLGYKIKLDTNGFRPDVLKHLVKEHLVDYIAMDIKNSAADYPLTAGIPNMDITPIRQSVSFLMDAPVSYEFRTTVTRELHNEKNMAEIGLWLKGCQAYFLQCFQDSGTILSPGFHAPSTDTLISYRQLLLPCIPNTFLRGIQPEMSD